MHPLYRGLALSRVVWLEVLEGAPNQQKQRLALRFLERLPVVEMTSSDGAWAVSQRAKYHLSHNIDAFDCLIAGASARLAVPLYTRNLKHFSLLIPGLSRLPYE